MAAPVRITELAFTGGEVVAARDVDVFVLVGPNNAGKSRTLAEIHRWLTHPIGAGAPVGAVALDQIGADQPLTPDEMVEWIRAHRIVRSPDRNRPAHEVFRSPSHGELAIENVRNQYRPEIGINMASLGDHLVRLLGPSGRLDLIGTAQRLEPGAAPESPAHYLLSDRSVAEQFDRAIRRAFGFNSILDAWGTNVRMRIHPELMQADFAGDSSNGYPPDGLSERLSELQVIEEQSDGVRAFAGIVLALTTTEYPLVLLDEPEAFLHPPQARLLGQLLGRIHRNAQLFVATHSLDILLGLLSSREASRVAIVRVTRAGEKVHARRLDPEDVRQLWSDPLLRFSRAFDGLFHRRVVVCEGDSDSLFYSAVASYLAPPEPDFDPPGGEHLDAPPSPDNPFDVMFTYAGGNGRIPMIVAALKAAGVPVSCVVDFDTLRNVSLVERLLRAQGFELSSEMRADLNILGAAVRGSAPSPTVGGARTAIAELMNGLDDGEDLPNGLRAAVDNVLDPAVGWSLAKRLGLHGVPAGEPQVVARRVLETLKTCGVFVVPVGQVESFVTDVNEKGTPWISAVIERDLIGQATEAHEFVRRVVSEPAD